MVTGVSILDYPALGSGINEYDKGQIRRSNWPNEINFAIRNGDEFNNTQFRDLLVHYKNLLMSWDAYVIDMMSEKFGATHPNDRLENNLFNFTKYIKRDMESFLTIVHGSYLTSNNNTQPIWSQTARKIFGESVRDDGPYLGELVHKNGKFFLNEITIISRKIECLPPFNGSLSEK